MSSSRLLFVVGFGSGLFLSLGTVWTLKHFNSGDAHKHQELQIPSKKTAQLGSSTRNPAAENSSLMSLFGQQEPPKSFDESACRAKGWIKLSRNATLAEVYCLYQQLGVDFVEDKQSLYSGSWHEGDIRDEQGKVTNYERLSFAIKSQTCPNGFYSFVHAQRNEGAKKWDIEESFDCQVGTREDFYIKRRAYIDAVPLMDNPQQGLFHMAPGSPFDDFLVACDDMKTYVLTRNGKFHRDAQGFLRDAEGCVMLGEDLNPYAWSKDLNPALIHVESQFVEPVSMRGRGRIEISFNSDNPKSAMLQSRRPASAQKNAVKRGYAEGWENPAYNEMGYPMSEGQKVFGSSNFKELKPEDRISCKGFDSSKIPLRNFDGNDVSQ